MAVAVVGNSCLKYYLQSYANRGSTSVTVVAVFSALAPIFTGALDYLALGTPLQVQYLGALPIMGGVALVVTARTQSREPGSLWAWQRALLGLEGGGEGQAGAAPRLKFEVAQLADDLHAEGAGSSAEAEGAGGQAGSAGTTASTPLLIQ